jgi:aspartyl-tRNA(Asn)/glutamyl-tRNA(Gln) amidotransferase subunit B
MTIATSPIPICCRWNWTRPGSKPDQENLPELPDAKRARFVKDLGLSDYDAGVLVSEKESADFYELAAKGHDPKLTANWLTSELFGRLNAVGKSITESPVSAKALGELVGLIEDNTISGRIAKDVFTEMFETGKSAAAIVDEKGLRQVLDTGAIDVEIDKIMAANADSASSSARSCAPWAARPIRRC